MQTMFGRKRAGKVTPRSTFSHSRTSNFAEEVLELEGELDFNCSLSTVQRLMQLYTEAIEYYESIKDAKYLHYQERMQKLLTRHDVIRIIKTPHNASATPPPQDKELIEKRKEESQTKQRLRSRQLNYQLNPHLSGERTAQQALKTHSNEASNLSQQLRQNLKSQHDSLNSRLRERQSRSRNASMTPVRQPSKDLRSSFAPENHSRPSLTEESDRSGGMPSSSPFDLFESQVEAIMEKFVESKMKVRKEIESKYEEELEEIKKMGDASVFKSLYEEMKKNKEQEIETAMKDLEEKRKAEISAVRKKLIN